MFLIIKLKVGQLTGNNAYMLSKPKYGNGLIADNGNKTYNFVFDYDDSFESTLDHIYN